MKKIMMLLPRRSRCRSIGMAHAVVDPNDLPQVACSDLKWGAAFVKKYPKAPQACIEGRVYQGKRYAKFDAKVYISPIRTS